MSEVTNVILSFSVSETDVEDDSDVISRVNEFFVDDGQRFIIPANDDWYGGQKVLERPTYVGAFNYFHLQEFIDFIKKMSWKYPEMVQVIVCGQEDDEYTTFWPCRPLERGGFYNVTYTGTIRN